MNGGFLLCGFDLRVWPPPGRATTDATEWEQATLYQAAKDRLGIHENSLQLLDPRTAAELEQLAELAERQGGTALIAIDFLEATVFATNPKVKPSSLQNWGRWKTLGLDVCDLNGLFSYFAMTESARSIPPLKGEEVLRALLIEEAANIAIPSHRPFVVSRIRHFVGT